MQKTIFDSIKKVDENNLEFWSARELMKVLEYTDWRNFTKVISKAKTSASKSYSQLENHFVEFNKKIKIGAGTNKESDRYIKDIKLSRYACYLIAQNADPSKESVALAQSYFAKQTRKQEIITETYKEFERFQAREKLKETEKKLSGVLSEHGVGSKELGEIRSQGDQSLFNNTTSDMKEKLKVSKSRPLADFLPTITLKAKDLAAEMTIFNTKEKDLIGKDTIKYEHVHNNSEIRKLLTNNGIFPENLPPEEDIKILEEKYKNVDGAFPPTELDTPEITISIIGITSEDDLQILREAIIKNPGKTKIRILYGSPENRKEIVRQVSLNKEFLTTIRRYIV